MGRLVVLTGRRFGLWVVHGRSNKPGSVRWNCECTGCGRAVSVLSSSLRSGHSQGCSKCRSRHPYKNKPKHNLSGRRFGRLVATSPVRTKRRWSWRCTCDCGEVSIVQSTDLLVGKVKSCGCLLKRSGPGSPRWAGVGSISGHYWDQIKHGAKVRGLEMSVSIEDAWNLLQDQNHCCALSGIPIGFSYGRGKKRSGTTASLDRKDSSMGYVTGNVQWVHKDINQMKMDLSEDRFIELCRCVALHAEKDE